MTPPPPTTPDDERHPSAGSGIRETLAGRHLLVTGVTGFLGKVLVAFLLDRVPELGRIIVVVRGRGRQDPNARLRRILATSPAFRPLRERHGDGLPGWIDARLEVVAGDVAEPLLGLDPSTRRRLRGSLDAVVHVAGLTDFDPDPRQALRTNVLGTQHAADAAAELAGGRLLHVSTAFVVGRAEGEVPETLTPGRTPTGATFDVEEELADLAALCRRHELPSARLREARARAAALGWPNVYTYTKALAEHRLAVRRDLDPVIARPTIVECARHFPLPGWVEGINTSAPILWLLSGWLRSLPSADRIHFDVVPVDDVVRGLVSLLAAQLREEAPRIAHLGTSASNPLRFDRALDLTGLAARRLVDAPERRGAARLARAVMRRLDAVPRPYDQASYGLPLVRRVARGLRRTLDELEPQEILPPAWYRRVGADLEARRKAWARECRDIDRLIGRVEEILRAYRPFTHDHDWVFRTDAVRALTNRLSPEDAATFGFRVDDLDWRSYWLDVQFPGVARWSWPLLEGRRAPVDPEPDWFRASSETRRTPAPPARRLPGEAAE